MTLVPPSCWFRSLNSLIDRFSVALKSARIRYVFRVFFVYPWSYVTATSLIDLSMLKSVSPLLNSSICLFQSDCTSVPGAMLSSIMLSNTLASWCTDMLILLLKKHNLLLLVYCWVYFNHSIHRFRCSKLIWSMSQCTDIVAVDCDASCSCQEAETPIATYVNFTSCWCFYIFWMWSRDLTHRWSVWLLEMDVLVVLDILGLWVSTCTERSRIRTQKHKQLDVWRPPTIDVCLSWCVSVDALMNCSRIEARGWSLIPFIFFHLFDCWLIVWLFQYH